MAHGRVGASALLVLLALSLLPAAAQACLDPGFSAAPEAGPGDDVPVNITDVKGGSTIEFYVDGQPVDVTDPTPAGPDHATTFRMPDLGSEARSAAVHMVVLHDDIDGGSYSTMPQRISYVAPAPPPVVDPPPSQPDAPAGATEPPAQPVADGHEQAEQNGQRNGGGFANSGTADGSDSTGAADAPTTAPAGLAAAAVAGSPTTSAVAQTGSTASGAAQSATTHEASAARSGEQIAASATAADPARGAVDPEGSGISRLLAGTSHIGPVAVPTIGLVALGVILLLATSALAAVFFVSARLMPKSEVLAVEVGEALDADAIEAELQQIIREETAKKSSALAPV